MPLTPDQEQEVRKQIIDGAIYFARLNSNISEARKTTMWMKSYGRFCEKLEVLETQHWIYILQQSPNFIHIMASSYGLLNLSYEDQRSDPSLNDSDRFFFKQNMFPLSYMNPKVLSELLREHTPLFHFTIDEKFTLPKNTFHFLLILLAFPPQQDHKFCRDTNKDLYVIFSDFIQEQLNGYEEGTMMMTEITFRYLFLYLLNLLDRWHPQDTTKDRMQACLSSLKEALYRDNGFTDLTLELFPVAYVQCKMPTKIGGVSFWDDHSAFRLQGIEYNFDDDSFFIHELFKEKLIGIKRGDPVILSQAAKMISVILGTFIEGRIPPKEHCLTTARSVLEWEHYEPKMPPQFRWEDLGIWFEYYQSPMTLFFELAIHLIVPGGMIEAVMLKQLRELFDKSKVPADKHWAAGAMLLITTVCRYREAFDEWSCLYDQTSNDQWPFALNKILSGFSAIKENDTLYWANAVMMKVFSNKAPIEQWGVTGESFAKAMCDEAQEDYLLKYFHMLLYLSKQHGADQWFLASPLEEELTRFTQHSNVKLQGYAREILSNVTTREILSNVAIRDILREMAEKNCSMPPEDHIYPYSTMLGSESDWYKKRKDLLEFYKTRSDLYSTWNIDTEHALHEHQQLLYRFISGIPKSNPAAFKNVVGNLLSMYMRYNKDEVNKSLNLPYSIWFKVHKKSGPTSTLIHLILTKSTEYDEPTIEIQALVEAINEDGILIDWLMDLYINSTDRPHPEWLETIIILLSHRALLEAQCIIDPIYPQLDQASKASLKQLLSDLLKESSQSENKPSTKKELTQLFISAQNIVLQISKIYKSSNPLRSSVELLTIMPEKLPQDIQHIVSLLFCFLPLPGVSNARFDDHIKARMKQLHQLINACTRLPLVQQLQPVGVDWLPDLGYSPTGIPATTKDFLSQLFNIFFDTESMELMWCGDRITSTSTTHTSSTSILVGRSTKKTDFSRCTDTNSLSH